MSLNTIIFEVLASENQTISSSILQWKYRALGFFYSSHLSQTVTMGRIDSVPVISVLALFSLASVPKRLRLMRYRLRFQVWCLRFRCKLFQQTSQQVKPFKNLSFNLLRMARTIQNVFLVSDRFRSKWSVICLTHSASGCTSFVQSGY